MTAIKNNLFLFILSKLYRNDFKAILKVVCYPKESVSRISSRTTM